MKNSLLGKRVVVTGADGFLGGALVRRLQERGCAEVCAVGRRDFDLVKPDDVERLYQDTQPHVVIHAAGVVGGIGRNRREPGLFFYQNIMMGVQLIEGARVHGIDKFVQVGTTCSYPRITPVPFREEDLWNGFPDETNAPYAIAKKALLVQCQAYRDQYGTNAIYVLPANLYGPGDSFSPHKSHVVAALIKRFVDAKESNEPSVEIWGTGVATREFFYIDDAAEGIILAAQRYDGREPVNLGSGKEVSIRDVASLIARETGFEGQIVWDSSKPDGQPRRSLDVTRARTLFGFQARMDFVQGLRQTIAWYRASRARDAAT